MTFDFLFRLTVALGDSLPLLCFDLVFFTIHLLVVNPLLFTRIASFSLFHLNSVHSHRRNEATVSH